MFDTTNLTTEEMFPAVFDLASLVTEKFEPINWAVEGMLPEGCILFAGRPKLGKSWFVLQLALAVASGENAFGDFPVNRGDVLYLALEDTRRRLQSRAKRLLADKPLPSGCKFAVDWPRIDEGGVEYLELWLQRNPATRMVIIDTFQKIKPSRGHNSDFETLSRLVQISHKFKICLLVVHHTRKTDADDPFDTVSGPTATASLSDGMLILKRARCSQDAELHITGRDIEESRKALRFDTESMKWEFLGEAAQVWRSQERTDIIDLLRKQNTSLQPAEIADFLDKSCAAVRKTLSRMVRENQILWFKGGYYDIKDEDREPSDERYIKHQILKQQTKELFEAVARVEGYEGIDKSLYEGLVLTADFFELLERGYGGPDRGG